MVATQSPNANSAQSGVEQLIVTHPFQKGGGHQPPETGPGRASEFAASVLVDVHPERNPNHTSAQFWTGALEPNSILADSNSTGDFPIVTRHNSSRGM